MPNLSPELSSGCWRFEPFSVAHELLQCNSARVLPCQTDALNAGRIHSRGLAMLPGSNWWANGGPRTDPSPSEFPPCHRAF
jgi:hypothetical protein